MEIYGQDAEEVYADYVCDNCDTPAARKISGTAGHAADFHPCPYCDTILLDINKPVAYDSTGFLHFVQSFINLLLMCVHQPSVEEEK